MIDISAHIFKVAFFSNVLQGETVVAKRDLIEQKYKITT